MKINIITPEKQEYLRCLEAIDESPKRLYFIGNLPAQRIPSVAVVGSRKPTAYGKEVTERIVSELARQGVIIISGLALGIDGLAHRAALDAGGVTLAVLANGLDQVYPSSHQQLAKEILAKDGALISEYEAGTPALPYNFLARNRIVSGLADAIIVIEAATRSGTLSTAAHALNQGREVFAVPGNITSPLSAGCNALIKQGAIPLTDSSEVLELIAPQFKREQIRLILGDTPEETTLIELLQHSIRDGDELLAHSNLDATIYTQSLSMLEIKGIIKALGNNQWGLR